MKLEITCPSCQERYVLDASDAGAELVCPACTTTIAVPEVVTEPAAPTPNPVPTVDGPKMTSAAPEPRPEPKQEIVCPRCNLHFSPRKQGAPVDTTSRPTVLIVEVEGYFRQMAEEALASEYDVRTANSVDEAEPILAGGGIDLMVLDLELEGAGTGGRLLRGPAQKACPVLIYTQRDESELYGGVWEELQKLGADDIVIQGMNVAESLSRKVGALLGREWNDEETTA